MSCCPPFHNINTHPPKHNFHPNNVRRKPNQPRRQQAQIPSLRRRLPLRQSQVNILIPAFPPPSLLPHLSQVLSQSLPTRRRWTRNILQLLDLQHKRAPDDLPARIQHNMAQRQRRNDLLRVRAAAHRALFLSDVWHEHWGEEHRSEFLC